MHCAEFKIYRGIDISATAIAGLQFWTRTHRHLSHVELIKAEATRLEGLEPCDYDVVILNSVIQYFPDADYLLAVLTKTIPLLSPKGRLFIGDIRHLGLMPVFHSSVQLFKASPKTTVGQLKLRIERAIALEKELTVEPGFFAVLGERLNKSVPLTFC